MNKKGFTILEIIICLAIISLIGTMTTLTLVNNNHNKLDKLNKKIIDAANTYINVEKDNDGDIYLVGINKGAKGVVLKVQDLVDKGYLDKNIITQLIKETGKDKYELKLLASNSIYNDVDEQCGTNLIEFTLEWEELENDKVIYLCPKNNSTEPTSQVVDNIKDYIIENSNTPTELDEITFDNYIANGAHGSLATIYITRENGLFYRKENSENIYYYRGDIDDNYLSIDFSTNDSSYIISNYRIISFTENYIKIISDEALSAALYLDYNYSKENIKEYVNNAVKNYIVGQFVFLYEELGSGIIIF